MKIIDDESPQWVFVDTADVALWVRVGPVWINGEKADFPVVWIELQEEHMQSNLKGPVMFTKEDWDTLNEKVQKAFHDRDY